MNTEENPSVPNESYRTDDHFVEITEMVEIDKGDLI